MKKPVLSTRAVLSVTVGLALAFLIPLLRAHDGDDGEHEHHRQKTCILLHPTPAAPAHARGRANIQTEDNDGAVSGQIDVKIRGLLAGTYTVTVFNRAQDTNAVLGTLTIRSRNGGDDDDNDDEDDDGDNDEDDDDDRQDSAQLRSHGDGDDDDDDGDHDGDDNEGNNEAQFPLPEGIGALDVGVISIADADGVEVLSGDFASPASMLRGTISARVRARSDDAAPTASGMASIRGRVWLGRANGTLTLNAKQLPPRSKLTLNVNGRDVGSVRTNRRGELRVYKSNRNVFRMSSVRLVTASGETALRADF